MDRRLWTKEVNMCIFRRTSTSYAWSINWVPKNGHSFPKNSARKPSFNALASNAVRGTLIAIQVVQSPQPLNR